MCNWKLYRRADDKNKMDRGIYVKHYKNIPMADMELVLVSIFFLGKKGRRLHF